MREYTPYFVKRQGLENININKRQTLNTLFGLINVFKIKNPAKLTSKIETFEMAERHFTLEGCSLFSDRKNYRRGQLSFADIGRSHLSIWSNRTLRQSAKLARPRTKKDYPPWREAAALAILPGVISRAIASNTSSGKGCGFLSSVPACHDKGCTFSTKASFALQ